MGTAYMSCLEELSKKKYKWEYVFTLQNDDIQIKTNEEIIQILKWLGGANDVEYGLNQKELIQVLYKKFNWTFKDLKLFRDEKLNNQVDTEGQPLSLKISKGYVQTSLARTFVDFIVRKLDLTQLLHHLNNCGEYGCDELFFQTLLATEVLKAPNAFTHKCIDKNISTPFVNRFSIWVEDSNTLLCPSGYIRNDLCMFGLEDLSVNLRDSDFLFANKMQADFDFGAFLCWHEEMRSRTLVDKGLKRLNSTFYQNWPQAIFKLINLFYKFQARFHKEMVKTGKVDIDKFNCNINKN
uniref:Reverse transcriptase domain-containing protein n=1 Tax=Meloidogyne incognita TaxID=6306 RepID=A0A914MRW7_MELIC